MGKEGNMANKNDIYCACCGKLKERGMFMTSLNPYHNKVLPLCKPCIKNKLKFYKDKTNSMGAALWCLCAELNYPMVQEVYNIIREKIADDYKLTTTDNPFLLYHSALKENNVIPEGFWQSDMMLDDFVYLGRDKVKIVSKDNNFDGFKELTLGERQKIWGNYGADDLDLLDDFYKRYTETMDIYDVAMELRYRDLCKAELRKRKADESGDISEITKAEDSIRKNLALLKLDKFENGAVSDEDKRIEHLIWKIENEKPCECEDLNKYKDFSGFGKTMEDIMRCVRNLIAGTRDYPNISKEEL